jgi:methyl-accepting chemotaxis protein
MSGTEERRTDSDTRLIVRIAILEAKHEEALRIRLYHETEIAKLQQKDSEMLTALNTIIGEFNALRKQIGTGFNVLCYVGGAIVIAISAFWTYSLSLDSKFAPKLEQVSQEVKASQDHIQQQKARVADVASEVEEVASDVAVIKKKKVMRASK